jgi:hypothetical protein
MRTQIHVHWFQAERLDTLTLLLENGDTVELVLCDYDALKSLWAASLLLQKQRRELMQTAGVLGLGPRTSKSAPNPPGNVPSKST